MKLGDWPVHVLVAQFGKIELMDEVMAVYRMHTGGVWSAQSPTSKLEEMIRMFKALDRELKFQHTRKIRQQSRGSMESGSLWRYRTATALKAQGAWSIACETLGTANFLPSVSAIEGACLVYAARLVVSRACQGQTSGLAKSCYFVASQMRVVSALVYVSAIPDICSRPRERFRYGRIRLRAIAGRVPRNHKATGVPSFTEADVGVLGPEVLTHAYPYFSSHDSLAQIFS